MTNFKEKEEVQVDNESKTCSVHKPADMPYEQYILLEAEIDELANTVVRQAKEITFLKRKIKSLELEKNDKNN